MESVSFARIVHSLLSACYLIRQSKIFDVEKEETLIAYQHGRTPIGRQRQIVCKLNYDFRHIHSMFILMVKEKGKSYGLCAQRQERLSSHGNLFHVVNLPR